jgi:hypothetical protein
MVEALRRGLESGVVMEDQIARRRESIPPPSVSRVMQKFGVSTPQDAPVQLPPIAPSVTTTSAPPPAPEPAPEQPRRRSGTPRVGVPVLAPPSAPAQRAAESAPRAAEPAPRAAEPAPRAEPAPPPPEPVQAPVVGAIDAPSGRAKTPTGPHVDSGGVSQVWYEDGERLSEGNAELPAVRPTSSAGTTDLSLLYDEDVPRRRVGLIIGVVSVVVVGGTLAFALTRGHDAKTPTPATQIAAAATTGSATAPADAAPSQIIEVADAAPEPPPIAATKKEPERVVREPRVDPPSTRTKPRDLLDFGDDPAKRRPGGDNATPTKPVTTPTNPVTTVVTVAPPKGPPGVSGTGGPQDPYSAGPTEDPGEAAPPAKKAEFYANLGQQQLLSGEIANAAASFKKASELDAKNATAVIGLGEIALRQGLFGDAIAHLRAAVKLAPKSSRVYTLLGEAYLSSGNNAVAADNLKKALQLDPDNAHARDLYNEASSHVPPPSDD